MPVTRDDLVDALAAYWGTKTLQLDNSRIAQAVGAGTSGSVRGGKQFDPVAAIIAKFFIEAGYPASCIHVDRNLELPGYFRPSKKWDVVVSVDGVLVAAFELKGLGGPSFGNNANNRVEEALGSSMCLRRAALADLYPGEQPWVGYLFVMEDASGSRKPVRVPRGTLRPDPIWEGQSYQGRFGITLKRLLDEKVYDSVCYLVSSASHPDPAEPVEALDWTHFAAAIRARIHYLAELGYPQKFACRQGAQGRIDISWPQDGTHPETEWLLPLDDPSAPEDERSARK